MTTCAFYIRKSTTEHVEEGNRSRELQLETCKNIAEIAGYTHVETYSQIVSGYSLNARRSEFARMLKDIESKRFDVLVAVREDRLGRRLSETARLLDLCEKTGIKIHTERGLIDPAHGIGTLEYNIMATIAQNESAMISARVKANRDYIKTRSWTGGSAPYGLIPDERNAQGVIRLISHPTEAAAVKRMVHLLLDEKKTIGETAQALTSEGFVTRAGQPWQYKAVQATILNPSIAGYASELPKDAPSRSPRWLQPVTKDGEPIKIHEALVTQSEYAQLRAIGAPRTTITRKTSRSPLLSGLVFCGTCGKKMHAGYSSSKDRIHRRYQCPGYALPIEQRCTNGIGALVLEEFILDFARGSLKDTAVRKALTDRLAKAKQASQDTELEDKRTELKEAQKAIEDELENALSPTVISALTRRLTAIASELETLDETLTQMALTQDRMLSLEDIFNFFESLQTSKIRYATAQIIEKITIDPSQGTITGGRKGSATDLSRVKIYRVGASAPISLPPGTPAPPSKNVECKSCNQLISRSVFRNHFSECSSEK